MRVFVIKIDLANADHRQLPQRRQDHHFIQNALSQCSLAKKAHRHLPVSSRFDESAAPVAIPALPPTMALAPKFPVAGSAMCIDPPLPRQYPASFPSSSANMRSGEAPLARQCP